MHTTRDARTPIKWRSENVASPDESTVVVAFCVHRHHGQYRSMRHSQTLRIRSQSCQRQSKLPRLPTTNESEREQAPTNRKSCKRAVGCKRHSQRDVEAKLVHHRSFELHAESIEDLHIDREWSSVQTLCADRCVSKCVCVCVTLSNCIITSKENPQSPYAGHRLFPNCNDAGAVVQTANRQIKE